MNRRTYLQLCGAAVCSTAFRICSKAETSKLAMPGPYPGRVVAVESAASVHGGKLAKDPIRSMLQKGMCELTGAPAWQDAWRQFFEPGDVVGIKINPCGYPVCTGPEVLMPVIEGIQSAGVKIQDIVVYERYRSVLVQSGTMKWLPAGLRVMHAAEAYTDIQTGIDGYDPDHYVELPFVWPGLDANDENARRSHAALFLSKHVNKVINLPVLKDHEAAGVTLALKNMSHGMFNNVNRSHPNTNLTRMVDFIPPVVSAPIVRNKVVLHILDGIRGIYHGGPVLQGEQFMWEAKTLYFATDPVAMDLIGWRVIDAKRVKEKFKPVAENIPDGYGETVHRQPEHIIAAGKLGLGEWDLSKIDLRHVAV